MSKCSIRVSEKFKKFVERQKNQETLSEMIEDIKGIREKSRTPGGFRKSVDKYIKEVGEESVINDYYDLIQLSKRSNNIKRVFEATTPAEGLRSLLRASNYNDANSGLSLEAIQSTRNIKYQTIIDQAFSDNDFKILASKQLDRDIIISAMTDGKEGNPAAANYAKTIKKLQNYIHKDKLDAGLQINYIKDYVVNQKSLYNAEKMKEMGKDAWVDFSFKNLDKERSFPNIHGHQDQKAHLGKIYDNTMKAADEAESTDFSKLPKDRLKRSLAKKAAKQRSLYYTPEGLANMFEKFSDKSLIESIMSDASKSAKDIAYMEVLGPSARSEHSTLVKASIKKLQKEIASIEGRKGAFSDTIESKRKEIIESKQNQIKEIKSSQGAFNKHLDEFESSANMMEHEKASGIMSNLRSLTSMSLLGGASFSALTDLPMGITALQVYTGENYFKLVGDVASSLKNNISPERQKSVASRLSIALESSMGSQLKIAGSEGAITKNISKINHLYGKVNPLQQQARFHRVAMTSVLSMHLGEWSGKSFSELDTFAKNGLLKAGIQESDWPAFKQMRQEIKDGEFGVDSTSRHLISDEVAKEVIAKHKSLNPAFVPNTPEKYRAYIEKRLDAYYNEFSNMAAPNPGQRERAVLYQGTKKGSLEREFFQTIGMLKSFTVKQASIMQRVYLANPNRKPNIAHLSGMFLGLTTMGYAVESLKAIANNKTPPDPTSPDTIKNAIIRSGAGSIVADALLSQNYRGGEDFFTSFVGGPVAGQANKALGMLKGDESLTSASDFIPGSNLWYLKSALNYTIMDDFKEMVSPGHNDRMQKRFEENAGMLWEQDRIL